MAIILEAEKKGINWAMIGGVAAILLAIFLAVYYLFFTPAPLIEVVFKSEVKEISRKVTLNGADISKLLEAASKSFVNRIPPPTKGTLGRPNPFLVF